MDRATDERLAELAAQGDEHAFGILYARYSRRLHGYCRSILKDEDDAHDALQSSMLKAFRALRSNGGDVQVRPWLFRIAHNESISLIRARRGHELLREDSWVSDDGPGAQAEAREELDGLVDGVLQLSERRRKALVMREFSGFGYPAIAKSLGTTAGAAKQAVFEARSALSARRSAAGLLGPLAPLWSAFTGWLGAGVPSAAKAGALVVALAAGTGTAEQLLSDESKLSPPVAEAAAARTPAVALAERAPARAAARAAARSAVAAEKRTAGVQRAAAVTPTRAAPPAAATRPRGGGSAPAARDHADRSKETGTGEEPLHQQREGGFEGGGHQRPQSPVPQQGAAPQREYAARPGGQFGGAYPRSGRSGYTSSMDASGR